MKRSRFAKLTPLFLAVAGSGSALAAEGVDLQLYRPSANGQGLFGVESPDVLPSLRPFVGLSFNYADAPLVVTFSDGTSEKIVPYQLVTHVQAGIGIQRWLDLGIDLPVVLFQEGTFLEDGAAVAAQALGDLRITPRFRILDRSRSPVSVAIVAPVTVPTGSEGDYVGESGLTLVPQVAVGGNPGRFTWAFNAGYRLRLEPVDLFYPTIGSSLALGSELTFGAALDVRVAGPLSLGAELQGAFGEDAETTADDPIEARIGAKLRTRSGLTGVLGGGMGVFTGGYGSPTWRGFAGIGYVFGGSDGGGRDKDGDGIMGRLDQCAADPEDKDGFQDEDGCPDPDNDQDKIEDVKDRCPTAPENLNGFEDEDGCPDVPDSDGDEIDDDQDKCQREAEDKDGFLDEDGCPDPDNDADTILDAQDRCPREAEDKDGFQDEDGCPEPDVDTDSDGVGDTQDKCPKKPETKNGFQDEDGCPEPDGDRDGVPDALDKCRQKPETKNGFQDEDGCPDKAPAAAASEKPAPVEAVAVPIDTDGDGLTDSADKCPKKPENKNGFQDEDGCPEPDKDGDGVVDGLDKCPKKPETKNEFQDEDGCPDQAPKAAATPAGEGVEKPAEGAASTPAEGTAAPQDTDGDGLADGVDKCPKKPETKNGFKDDDGCPEPDADGDGLADGLDKCPKMAENKNDFKDEDGCPEPDTDGDGLVDGLDKCPKKAETKNGFQDEDGCPDRAPKPEGQAADAASTPAEGAAEKPAEGAAEPRDTDGDGLTDGVDKCPKKAETKNGFQDEDGCPEPDMDGDGLADGLDKCPKKAETINDFKDEDGCPEPDTDGDGIVDGLDKCPKKPEAINNFQDEDGCPDEAPKERKVELQGKHIELPEQVQFDSGAANLREESHRILDDVVAILKANADLKVQIRGHTDNEGEADANLTLSRQRAEAVMKYLVEKGIDAARLKAEGFGESRPLVTNATTAGRQRNRRVEFNVE